MLTHALVFPSRPQCSCPHTHPTVFNRTSSSCILSFHLSTSTSNITPCVGHFVQRSTYLSTQPALDHTPCSLYSHFNFQAPTWDTALHPISSSHQANHLHSLPATALISSQTRHHVPLSVPLRHSPPEHRQRKPAKRTHCTIDDS